MDEILTFIIEPHFLAGALVGFLISLFIMSLNHDSIMKNCDSKMKKAVKQERQKMARAMICKCHSETDGQIYAYQRGNRRDLKKASFCPECGKMLFSQLQQYCDFCKPNVRILWCYKNVKDETMIANYCPVCGRNLKKKK